nr:unnamed protein product [Callosobruchus analis]
MTTVLNLAVKRFFQTTARRAAVQVEGPSAVSGQHEGSYKTWKNLSLFVAFPAIVLCAVNCVLSHQSGTTRGPHLSSMSTCASGPNVSHGVMGTTLSSITHTPMLCLMVMKMNIKFIMWYSNVVRY